MGYNSISDLSKLSGKMLIPGYGAFFGTQFGHLSDMIDEYAPQANYDRNSFANDVTWLSEKKYVVIR